MISMQGFDLLGEDFHLSSPLSVPALITDNTTVWPVDRLKGQPAQR